MSKRTSWIALVAVVAAVFATAQPIANWSAPPSWSGGSSHARNGMSPMDVTNPLPFVGVTPCRIADTRGNGFSGAYGPPSLAGGVPRSFTLAGQCGIPTSAGAISLNVTVTNPTGPGFILIYPQGGSQPLVSTLNYLAGQTVANAAVVPLGTGGGVTIIAGVSGTDLILDTNGYYYSYTTGSHVIGSGEQFAIEGNIGSTGVIFGMNDAGSTSGAFGGLFVTASSTTDSAGVVGRTTSVIGTAAGVWGRTIGTANDATGVRGTSDAIVMGSSFVHSGVRGESAGTGVLGVSNRVAVQGSLLDGSGNAVSEGRLGAGGPVPPSGVLGFLSTAAADTAGVLGINGTGPPLVTTGFSSAGVRGEGDQGTGVLGISGSNGVVGLIYDNTQTNRGTGYLGKVVVGPTYYAVYGAGDFGGTGNKYFVEPHPTDATKVIRYACLESREVGTYFRGTATSENGRAVIEIPEDFRVVTDEAGLTVQLTPVRSFAQMYVESEDLHQVVVRSSKDVTFHYLVHGVRRASKDFEAVRTSGEFMPESASARMPGYLTEEARRRLIANGTYNADGTVNLVTAERVGWMRIWREREAATRTGTDR